MWKGVMTPEDFLMIIYINIGFYEALLLYMIVIYAIDYNLYTLADPKYILLIQ